MVIAWNLEKPNVKLKSTAFDECKNVGEKKFLANSAKVGPKENNYGLQNGKQKPNALLQPELVVQ